MFALPNTCTLLPIVPATTQPLELPVTVNIANVFASPNLDMILPTVRESMKYRELPAAVNTTAVLFVPIVPSRLKTVHMAVPNITPVTAAFPAKETRIATFLTSPVPMVAHLTTAVQSVRIVMRILTVMCPINRVIRRDVLRPTLVENVLNVKTIWTAMSILCLVLTDAKHIILVLNALSVNLKLFAIPAHQTGAPHTVLVMGTVALTVQFNPVTPDAAALDAPILAKV